MFRIQYDEVANTLPGVFTMEPSRTPSDFRQKVFIFLVLQCIHTRQNITLVRDTEREYLPVLGQPLIVELVNLLTARCTIWQEQFLYESVLLDGWPTHSTNHLSDLSNCVYCHDL